MQEFVVERRASDIPYKYCVVQLSAGSVWDVRFNQRRVTTAAAATRVCVACTGKCVYLLLPRRCKHTEFLGELRETTEEVMAW